MGRANFARRLLWGLLTALGLLAISALLAPPLVLAADPPALTVCPTCAVRSIGDALAQAAPGARIVVDGGRYPGGLVIDKPVQLSGENGAVIDAGEQGTAVTITAPGVTVENLTIRGTGISLDHEDAAVMVKAERATIAGNRIEDALFGIYLKQGHDSVIRDNVVESKTLPVDQRGDAIRAWYSNNVQVERNVARNGRDIILW